MNDYKQIVKNFGSPLYLYSESQIKFNFKKLTSGFTYQNIMFCFAAKANSNISILNKMKYHGLGADCVSIGEMKTVLKIGFEPKKIRFTPTFAHEDEIKFAFENGIQVSIDSLCLVEWVSKYYPHQPIGLRLNPSVMAGAYAKTSVGHAKAKFGIGLHYLNEILALVNNNSLKVSGLHIHSGSDILDISQFMEAVEVLLSVAPKFTQLEYLDLGSGFKVPYFEGDKETDIISFGAAISERISDFCKLYGRELMLIFEPGKFLVSNAGQFLVTCTGIKENGGIIFAGVDSGFNHLIRPMFYGAYHTIRNLSNPHGTINKYDVVGNICETDTFASDREIPEIRVGDILCFENAGAYCFSMASSYNSRPKPAEIMVMSNGEAKLIRKREHIEDLWAGQVDL